MMAPSLTQLAARNSDCGALGGAQRRPENAA